MALGHRTPSCFSSSSCTDPENREFHLSVKGHCCLLPTTLLGLQFTGHMICCGFIFICPRSKVMMPPVVLFSLVLCQSLPAPLPVSSPGRPRLPLPKSHKGGNLLWPQVQVIFSPNNNNAKCLLLWYFLLPCGFKIHCRVGGWINSLKPQPLTAWKLDSGLNFPSKAMTYLQPWIFKNEIIQVTGGNG